MRNPNQFHRVLLSSAICMFIVPAALAQNAASSAIEEIMIKGVRQPYRGDMPLESLPQQVQIISADMLSNLGVVDLQSALDMAGGVARQNTFGGLWDSFAIRGFAGDENVPSGYLINGFSGGRGFSGRRDASNIESIEVLKGPGSALYGRGEPGGTINLVTKKPQFETEGYIKTSAGRYDTYRVEGDYTTGVTDKFAFRINGAYDDAESFRDTVESEKLSLTPSFVYLLSERTAINYEMEYLKQEAPFDRGIVAIDGDPEVLPSSRFLGEPEDGPVEIDAMGHQLMIQHDMKSGWTALGALGYRESTFEGCSSEAELAGARQPFFTDGETLSRQRRCRDYDAEDLSGRLELSGTLKTGTFTHHVLIGVDYFDYQLDSLQRRFRPGPNGPYYAINVFDPVYGQPLPTNLTVFWDQLDEQNGTGLYFQNQIDITEKWQILIGLRYDDFEQDFTNRLPGTTLTQSHTELSPRAGLVYEFSPSLTFYGSYSEGFRPNSGANFAGSTFEPELSESYEVGVKWRTSDDRMYGTIAFFSAEKSNILSADPVNAGFSAALGEAESEGVEVDFTSHITENLHLWASYAYVDAKTSNDVINADWGVNIPAGSPLVNIPEHSANLTLSQQFTVGDAPATVGLGVNYVDDRLGETIDTSYKLESYTLVRLFGSYSPTSNIKLFLNLDNLLNEKHNVSSYSKLWTTPGSPMTWKVGVQYSF